MGSEHFKGIDLASSLDGVLVRKSHLHMVRRCWCIYRSAKIRSDSIISQDKDRISYYPRPR